LAIVGEAGAERITPLDRADSGSNGTQITINAPLVHVQGSLDRATADYVLQEMENRLQNIVIADGSSTSKIRFQSRGNLAPSSNL
jgi:hypothetical protein